MKKSVAVIYGGNSSEYEISILSGRYTASMIDREKFDVYEVLLKGADWEVVEWENDQKIVKGPVEKGDFSFNGVKFDIAFPMIHGVPGENGLLQGYFEMLEVPCASCSAFVNTVAFSKYSCKSYLRGAGIQMADEVVLRKGDEYNVSQIIAKLGLPLFVKPADGGSSFGITKVKIEGDLAPAIEYAFEEGDVILVESYIPGREMTQGIYKKGDQVIALPVTEIISYNEYFDYEAKYLGKSDEVCPAHINEDERKLISEVSEKIYRFMGCSGLIRIDYILNERGLFFLEINTAPGMTKMSLVPKMVAVSGQSMTDFLTGIIEANLPE
ncbi:MAG: D-alanine--D-alanine ligase [Bacteroidales bacterium]|nr:D-alanine--D-alanine ligase [Bacteroidales bacterium]